MSIAANQVNYPNRRRNLPGFEGLRFGMTPCGEYRPDMWTLGDDWCRKCVGRNMTFGMARSGTPDASSCRGSWVWNWRNRNCGERAEGSANNGTVSCSVDHDGGRVMLVVSVSKKRGGGFQLDEKIEVVRGREIKVR
jgi:hypothetical protein